MYGTVKKSSIPGYIAPSITRKISIDSDFYSGLTNVRILVISKDPRFGTKGSSQDGNIISPLARSQLRNQSKEMSPGHTRLLTCLL